MMTGVVPSTEPSLRAERTKRARCTESSVFDVGGRVEWYDVAGNTVAAGVVIIVVVLRVVQDVEPEPQNDKDRAKCKEDGQRETEESESTAEPLIRGGGE